MQHKCGVHIPVKHRTPLCALVTPCKTVQHITTTSTTSECAALSPRPPLPQALPSWISPPHAHKTPPSCPTQLSHPLALVQAHAAPSLPTHCSLPVLPQALPCWISPSWTHPRLHASRKSGAHSHDGPSSHPSPLTLTPEVLNGVDPPDNRFAQGARVAHL